MYYNEKPNLRNFSRIARKYFSEDIMSIADARKAMEQTIARGLSRYDEDGLITLVKVAKVLRGDVDFYDVAKHCKDAKFKNNLFKNKEVMEVEKYLHGNNLCPKLNIRSEMSKLKIEGETLLKPLDIDLEPGTFEHDLWRRPRSIEAHRFIRDIESSNQNSIKWLQVYNCASILVDEDFYDYISRLGSDDNDMIFRYFLVLMYMHVYGNLEVYDGCLQ